MEKEGREGSKRFIYSALRSFFLHNRAELPRDKSFRLRGDRPRVVGGLTVGEVRRILDSCNECHRAVFLCMLQAGMGIGELLRWSREGLQSLRDQIQRGVHPVRIDLPGRKQGRNRRPYYTFIGRDAVDALKVWLRLRPRGTDDIFVNQLGRPLSDHGVRTYWTKHLKRLGIIEKPDDAGPSTRYGKNLHELRDLFRTRWQMSGAAPAVAEFMMGHVVDPLGYNKFWRDPDYVADEYLKAEPWLNVVSEEPEKVHVRDLHRMKRDYEERLRRFREEMRELVREELKRLEKT